MRAWNYQYGVLFGRRVAATHFSRHCRVSKFSLRVMASGLSATASTTGLRAALTVGGVSDSGSFSESCRSAGASGVGMAKGSLR